MKGHQNNPQISRIILHQDRLPDSTSPRYTTEYWSFMLYPETKKEMPPPIGRGEISTFNNGPDFDVFLAGEYINRK